MDVAPDAVGSGVVSGMDVVGPEAPHPVTSAIRMMITPERIHRCFMISCLQCVPEPAHEQGWF